MAVEDPDLFNKFMKALQLSSPASKASEEAWDKYNALQAVSLSEQEVAGTMAERQYLMNEKETGLIRLQRLKGEEGQYLMRRFIEANGYHTDPLEMKLMERTIITLYQKEELAEGMESARLLFEKMVKSPATAFLEAHFSHISH